MPKSKPPAGIYGDMSLTTDFGRNWAVVYGQNSVERLPCIRCAKKLQGKKQKGNAEQHTFYGIYVIALINDNNQ